MPPRERTDSRNSLSALLQLPGDASKSVAVCCPLTASRGLMTGALALGVVLCASTWGSNAVADEPVPPVLYDAEKYPPPGTGWWMAAAGIGTTAVWYGGAVGLSYLWPSAPSANRLRYPVAGPWMALAKSGCPASEPDCSLFWVVLRAVLTTVDGIGQAGGLALLAEAAFVPTAPSDSASAGSPPAEAKLELTPVPFVSEDGAGIGFVGRF